MNILRNTLPTTSSTALQTDLKSPSYLGVMADLQPSLLQQQPLSSSSGPALIDPIVDPNLSIPPKVIVDPNRLIDRSVIDRINDSLLGRQIVYEPGSTLNTARDWGTISFTRQITQSVDDTDLSDIYKVNIGAGNFNISLTGMTADANLRLIRDLNQNGTIDDGEILASSTRGSNKDETINLSDIVAGEYYIEVSRNIGNTSYTLNASNTRPNDLLGVEQEVNFRYGPHIASGTISNSNTSDIYRFSVQDEVLWGGLIETGVSITLSGLTGNSDIRLIKDVNGNGIVDSGDQVQGSYQAFTQAERITQFLRTGTYFLQVNQFSGTSDYHLTFSTNVGEDRQFRDSEILGEYRYFGANGIDRQDMINILRAAKDEGTIDGNELQDLRHILQTTDFFHIPHVGILANKIVNGDPANARSGIGDLSAGVSASRMESLIGKWFYGTDRPVAAGSYRQASGSLFQNGISFRDVDQGSLGDCYFLASLGAVARQSPNTITNMFIDNNDGTFTVRFFTNGTLDYVTVDRFLPTDTWGNFIYANRDSGMAYDNVNNELWVALAEKAYAQANESGRLERALVANSYDSIGAEGGYPVAAIRQITGLNTTWYGVSQDMGTAFNAGKMVVLLSKNSTDLGVVSQHCYVLTDYNAATQRYTLYNPWGGSGSEIELTLAQIADNFRSWDTTA